MSDSMCNLRGSMHGSSCSECANNLIDADWNIQKDEIIISITPSVPTFFRFFRIFLRKHIYIIQPLLVITFQLVIRNLKIWIRSDRISKIYFGIRSDSKKYLILRDSRKFREIFEIISELLSKNVEELSFLYENLK